MADEKTDIVMHNGRMVVMNGNIIMGPCDSSWVLRINGMSFLKFSQKISSERVREDFVFTTHNTPVYGDSTTSETRTHVYYLSIDGDFVDGGSRWSYSWSDTQMHIDYTSEITSLTPLGLDGFALYKMDEETGRPRRLTNLGELKPEEGTYILDMSVSAVVQQRTSAYKDNQYSGFTQEGSGKIAEGVDVFLEFEITKIEDDGDVRFEITNHEILSCMEAYARYNEYFAFMQEYYFVGLSTTADVYSRGTFEMDVTVTVEKNGGN